MTGRSALLLLARGDAALLGEPRRAVGFIFGDGHDHRGEEKRVLTPFPLFLSSSPWAAGVPRPRAPLRAQPGANAGDQGDDVVDGCGYQGAW